MAAVKEVPETTATDLGALLDAGDGAVVTLVAGQTRLAAHRAVLEKRSTVFKSMFANNEVEVKVENMDGPVLRLLLSYMYTLQAPQHPNMAPQLLEAASTYELSGLKDTCEQQVVAELALENAAALGVLALRLSCPRLLQAVTAFVKDHTHQVVLTQSWKDTKQRYPQELLDLVPLIVEPPAENSAPATTVGAPSPGTCSQPHSDHGRTPATAVPSTAARHTPPPPGHTAVFRPRVPASIWGGTTHHPRRQTRSDRGQTLATAVPPKVARHTLQPDDAAVSRFWMPATTWSGTAPSNCRQPSSDHRWTPAAASQPNVARHSPPPDYAAVSRFCMPATTWSGTTPSTWRQSSSGHSWTPGAASQPNVARHSPPPDGAAVSRFWTLSGEEKGRRLIEAAKEGALEQLHALLAAGANTGARGRDSWTALHWAAYRGHLKAVSYLVGAGAEVDVRTSWNYTPLHWAAYHGHAGVVWRLLAASADPNARGESGWTPLHGAAINGHTQAVAALLEVGADRVVRDDGGRTPLDLARQNNKQQLVEMLTQH
ncbi:poly [ADP-ribose] polymerase tankyrase-1-like [Schistocerca americana]|uniref:poly [ADP-ribose] polymerase tankyrase-1-like n=1 Tax=Schistocerca americana TaxID=7009 RepID=UPI001F4FD92C|nr:poly [ADP-ribose] polymerase tankyrase-1-like [Schistocerca americana]